MALWNHRTSHRESAHIKRILIESRKQKASYLSIRIHVLQIKNSASVRYII
ncbi:hypothetical protein [Paenibacillus polymyxa]|uniref:hypothetical protein n=1 Tax=Paenibacillus polymyxa TaxID=1406 RepID=UPI00287FD875|nr:hypothetical protein [Paenibacillus polymyxa]